MLIGKNILFLYPSFQQKLFAQQSIVIIKQFIDEIKIAQKGSETNFFILTTNDLAKIVFDNDITILQDKITKNSILSVIKRYKIDTLIHLVGNENYDKILNNESFLKKKGLNIFYKEFYIYNKKKRYFSSLAKQSGFYLNKARTLKDRTNYKDFSVVAIKDAYNNQHILDFFSVASIGSNKLFFAPAYLNGINQDTKDIMLSILQKFGESLPIKNLIYTINLSITENGDIVFNNISYGLSEETIFSLQRSQINLATITIKILEKKSLFYNQKTQTITYSYSYKNTLKINFVSKFNDCHLPSFVIKNKKCTNKYLIDEIIANNKRRKDKNFFASRTVDNFKKDIYLDFQSSSPDYCFNKIENDKIYNRYILIILDDEDVNDCNDIAVFANICNKIQEHTGKEILLLLKFFPPLLSLINFKHVIVVDEINESTIANIINSFAIKYIYTNIKNSTTAVVFAASKCEAEIYGFDKNDIIFYDKSENICNIFAKKIGCNFKTYTDNTDCIFYVSCINDKRVNSLFNIILSKHFAGNIEAGYVSYPPVFENFEIQTKIEECVEKILANIKSVGPLYITFSYKDGELSILDIKRTASFYYFVIHSFVKKQVIIDIIVKSILGKKIDTEDRKNSDTLLLPYKNDPFYKTAIFKTVYGQLITISGYSNKHNLDEFVRLAF